MSVDDKRPIVGFLVDWLEDPYQRTIFDGVCRAAENLDAHLVCYDSGRFLFSHKYESNRNILYELIDSDNIDGLLLLTGALIRFSGEELILEFIRKYKDIPIVSLSQEMPGVTSIITDNCNGMREMVRHLAMQHDIRNIAYIGGPDPNQDARERRIAFQEAAAELGLSFDPESAGVEGDFTRDSGRKAVPLLLQRMAVKPEAIVAANDDMAIGAIEALSRMGFKVPQDVAVVGFDDIVIGLFSSPPLTTITQNLQEQGYRGFETLLRMIRKEKVPEKIILPARPVIRESCGCYSESIRHVPVAEEAEAGDILGSLPASSWTSDILARMRDNGCSFPPEKGKKAVQDLVSAFLQELGDPRQDVFLDTWKLLIQEYPDEESSGLSCQMLLSELRRVSLPFLEKDRALYRKGESFLHQARIMLGEMLVYAEKHKTFEIQEEQRVLNYLREDLLIVFDEEALMRSLARALPQLGIQNCHIARFAEETKATLIMSMKSGKMDKWDAVPFPSRFLVPGGLHAISRRTTWIVEALAHYECMGYILIQLGTKNYKTYGEIRRIVSSTLQGTRLFVQAREQNENLKRQSETLKGSLERMHQLIGGVINTLSLTLETRDPYTAGHQRRVSDLARSISTELSMSADEIESIRLSASVHDLGKIYVPSEILNKPGKLREAEMHLIQLHPQIAFDILKTIEFPWPIGEIVLQHHERMDGSGYPQGLTGDRITAAARIISVADVVEAMASHRPYRASLGLDAALEEIERFRGVHYDADAVDACLKLFRSKGYMFR